MIIGIGNDIIDIRRIEKTLERHGSRFTDRVFTEVERRKSDRRAERAASYAKRFAAKEACSKALGTGLSQGVYWRDMGVVNEPSGKPTLQLTEGAGRRLAAMTPPGKTPRIHLTMTDEYPYAQAIVIIEAI
ncbi:MAG: holo-ACP synthase [Rhizobiales bacterium]|nr:holo-ACP synthase [Hyphomicrobiales bacterium]